MEFVEMRDLLIKHFNEMVKDTTHLFEVEVDKDELWNKYLDLIYLKWKLIKMNCGINI